MVESVAAEPAVESAAAKSDCVASDRVEPVVEPLDEPFDEPHAVNVNDTPNPAANAAAKAAPVRPDLARRG